MKKFGVLLCVMLCVPMFAFKANNEEQIILTVQYERPDKVCSLIRNLNECWV